jgi:hypothetical protein
MPGDMLRGPRFEVRPEDAQAVHVLVERGNVLLGHLRGVDALDRGPVDDLVVDVREVADKGDLPALVAQIPDQNVEDHGGPGMPDMAVIVRRDPADVQAGMIIPQRLKFFLFPVQTVVEEHNDSHCLDSVVFSDSFTSNRGGAWP